MNAANTAYCKSLLNRVPNQLINMNNGLSTLQFQSLSASAQRPQNLLQGGTQDNGTFQFNGSPNVWPQVIYGDGGLSGFNVANDTLRFNTFTGQANDANFRNGDPTRWVIISAPILSSPEGAFFYPPIIADPHPAFAGSIFQGSFSVWRTQDWGGDQAHLEADCPSSDVRRAAGLRRFRDHRQRCAFHPVDRSGVGKPAEWCRRLDSANRAKHRDDVGGNQRWPRVYHRQRQCSSSCHGRLEPRRSQPGKREHAESRDQRDSRRSRERASRVDFLQRLQRQHAGAAWPCVRSDVERIGGGNLGRSQLQPAGLSDHGDCSRRSDGRPLRGIRFRCRETSQRSNNLGRGWQRVADGRSGRTDDYSSARISAATHGRCGRSRFLAGKRGTPRPQGRIESWPEGPDEPVSAAMADGRPAAAVAHLDHHVVHLAVVYQRHRVGIGWCAVELVSEYRGAVIGIGDHDRVWR